MNLKYMELAIQEAKKAYKSGEIPVGAVIVKEDKIIAKAHNQKEKNKNVICHAEMIAIKKASKKINNWRLSNCDIYITLFPCPMCASAIQQSRIKNVYYALQNSDLKTVEIVQKIFLGSAINKSVHYEQIDCDKESLKLLQNFFQKKR